MSTTSKLGADMLTDAFNGDNAKLIDAIEALLDLDAQGALVPHGVGGHARTMLASAAVRLARQPAAIDKIKISINEKGSSGAAERLANRRAAKMLANEASKPAVEIPFAGDIAQAIHYPECWDTAAYPNFVSALREVYSHFKCSECASSFVAEVEYRHAGWWDISGGFSVIQKDDPAPGKCVPLYTRINVAATPSAPSVEQDERGAFEASFKAWTGQSISFDKVTDDEGDERYADEWLQGAWIGWQARAASTSANVAQGAEAVATVKVYETYTGQNGWTEVAQEEYDRTKDKYEHRIRRVPAPPAQTALTDDARECLLDVTTHFDNLRAGLCAQRSEATNSDDGDGIAYWNREIRVLERMKAQAERALTAAQSASGETK